VSQCWLMSELGLAQKRGDEYSKRLLLDGGNALVIENRLYLRRLLVLDARSTVCRIDSVKGKKKKTLLFGVMDSVSSSILRWVV
jgi:hypothetical protein